MPIHYIHQGLVHAKQGIKSADPAEHIGPQLQQNILSVALTRTSSLDVTTVFDGIPSYKIWNVTTFEMDNIRMGKSET